MALVSLKQEGDEDIAAYRPNQYGYGTEIQLNSEQCEALGLTKMLRVGQPVRIRATGVVTRSVEEIEASTDSGGKDNSCCIQLTEIDVSLTGTANPAKAAQMLYGDDD